MESVSGDTATSASWSDDEADALEPGDWRDLPESPADFAMATRVRAQQFAAKRFLIELRLAFQVADTDQIGSLTYDQWLNSSMRRFIQDGKISAQQFAVYFRRIDANADGELTWDELVYYLMKDISSSDLKLEELSARFIRKSVLPVPPRKQSHRNMVLRSGTNPHTERRLDLLLESGGPFVPAVAHVTRFLCGLPALRSSARDGGDHYEAAAAVLRHRRIRAAPRGDQRIAVRRADPRDVVAGGECGAEGS
jgi:hypothetical protein